MLEIKFSLTQRKHTLVCFSVLHPFHTKVEVWAETSRKQWPNCSKDISKQQKQKLEGEKRTGKIDDEINSKLNIEREKKETKEQYPKMLHGRNHINTYPRTGSMRELEEKNEKRKKEKGKEQSSTLWIVLTRWCAVWSHFCMAVHTCTVIELGELSKGWRQQHW